ncbi:MAG: hypothetical protein L3J71_02515 [Victivallaceae bacterium]|nr:hypothetical protein [Victivallaceae bacterium]
MSKFARINDVAVNVDEVIYVASDKIKCTIYLRDGKEVWVKCTEKEVDQFLFDLVNPTFS